MNPITKTYDADKWQLVPKVATIEHETKVNNALCDEYGLSFIADNKHFARDAYRQWLAAAPQPETLSPWLPIDEFLKAQTYGIVWIKTKDDTRLCDYSVLNPKFIGVITGAQFSIEEIVYVMPLTRPQAPEVE